MTVLTLEEILFSFLAATIRLATPILFAGIGEIFAERSGVLNLGIEGIMLMGALSGLTGIYFTNNVGIGIILGITVGALMGLLMAILSVTLRVNQVLAGLSIFYLGLGLSSFIWTLLPVMRVAPLAPTIIPFLSQIPVVGPVLFQQNFMVYLALISIPISGLILYRTTFGLKISAVGENPKAADTVGINVNRVRYLCVIIGGMLAGIAGAYLTIGWVGGFTHNMVGGGGFIAVAIVYFGKWSPYRTLAGALLFGGAFAFQIRLQPMGVEFPYEFLLMLPYILTLVFLIVMGRKVRGPASLSLPFERGER